MQPTAVFLPGKPMDRGAWRATVHEVAKSQTPLSIHALSSLLLTKSRPSSKCVSLPSHLQGQAE